MSTNANVGNTRGIGFRIVLAILVAIGFWFIGPLVVSYMLPTILVWVQDTSYGSIKTVAIINALVAWTIIGWLIMVFWAAWKWTK